MERAVEMRGKTQTSPLRFSLDSKTETGLEKSNSKEYNPESKLEKHKLTLGENLPRLYRKTDRGFKIRTLKVFKEIIGDIISFANECKRGKKQTKCCKNSFM